MRCKFWALQLENSWLQPCCRNHRPYRPYRHSMPERSKALFFVYLRYKFEALKSWKTHGEKTTIVIIVFIVHIVTRYLNEANALFFV